MTNAVVDALMDLEEGDRVRLETEYYAWAAPFRVDTIEPQIRTAPNDKVWIAKHIELEPARGNASGREFDVYPNASPPNIGSGYGVLTSVEHVGQRDGGEVLDASERCHWIERPADEIVAASPINRSLEEVLADVERHDTVLDITRRFGVQLAKTKKLLWELGLRSEGGHLLEADVLRIRIGEIREVYC